MEISNFCTDYSFKNLYSIDKFQIEIKNQKVFTPFCPVCKSKLYVRAIDSPKTRTHFAHYKNQSCRSYNFDELKFKTKVLNPTDVFINLINFFCNLTPIYNKICSLLGYNISTKSFIDTCFKINPHIFNIKNFPTAAFPYIWLNRLPIHQNIFYLFTTSSVKSSLWNIQNSKNALFKVDTSFSQHQISPLSIDFTFLNNINFVLDKQFLNEVFSPLSNHFNLSDSNAEYLLKDILSYA